jgi:hypothetical protein
MQKDECGITHGLHGRDSGCERFVINPSSSAFLIPEQIRLKPPPVGGTSRQGSHPATRNRHPPNRRSAHASVPPAGRGPGRRPRRRRRARRDLLVALRERLDRPEKFLYVFSVDADAKDNDFLAVVDVDPASPKYGTILHTPDLGSKGNETHHFGFTDDRTHIWGLYVSCFASDEIQQWDVSDLKNPRLTSTVKPGVQPNMMHLTGDGKRMSVSNSLLSTMDRSGDFWVKLVRVGPDGMTIDGKFHLDFTKFPTGPARGHDLLLN